MDQPVRWTVRVSNDTDVAVRWRVLDQTVAETKARNVKVPVADIEAAISEALYTVRAERFAARR